MWNVKVISVTTDLTASMSRQFQEYLEDIPSKDPSPELQNTNILGTAHKLRNTLTMHLIEFKIYFP
jgi:hypothetical protein